MVRYIVALVLWARHPIMPKLELHDAIAEPVESHVHGIRALGGDGVVDHAEGRGVVGLDRGGGLRVAHFGECVPGGDRRAAIYIEGADFGLRGGRHDGLDDLRDGEDAAVVRRVGGVIGEGKMAAGATAGAGL